MELVTAAEGLVTKDNFNHLMATVSITVLGPVEGLVVMSFSIILIIALRI